MIKSEIKEFLLTLFNNVWIWIALLIILLVIYALFTGKRDAIPKLFDIREIIRGYYKVFPIQIDFLYLLAVVSLLARITMLLNLNVDKTFSQIGVILSLLVSAIIGLIPMVLDKSDYIQNSTVKNLSHKQKLLYIEDIVQTGMFDILISIIDLILIFLSIGTTSKDTTSLLHSLLIFSIYWLFYLFSFNILIIMHKLYVVYFK
ncbi:hypothetical protein [Monoglobus pectinilyticus]|uniref:hypothetical protein n=1 Tax=Monoglobus pectinilyticus TaxID=1981510 RepID=UPI00399BD581